jgi:hypothetical protein
LNKYNLSYVLQNKASRQKHVFKIGVSTASFCLKNYIDYNGGRTDKPFLTMGSPEEKESCLGIYLWYLAGQKNKLNSAMKKTTKDSIEIEDSYRTSLTWNRQHEKFLKDELKKHKFTTIQGYEWFIVDTPKKIELFRKIIVDLTNQTLKPDEKIRKQPARGVDKWIGQTFTDDGEMFEITGTSIVKGQKVVDYINEKGKEYYSNIDEVKEWLEQPAS